VVDQAADLSGAVLGEANWPSAQLHGLDLTEVLSLGQPQLDAADGDAMTQLPDGYGDRPDGGTKVPKDLHGYFIWSLLDNCEWAHRYTKRFGLNDVDDQTQRLVPRRALVRWRHPPPRPPATAPARRGS
jgi:hypothetical protein